MTNPIANPNIPFLVKIGTDLLVGIEIRAGTGGDKAKEATNAILTVAVANAIVLGAQGNAIGMTAALDALVATPGTDPAKVAALQTLIGWIGTKAAALQNLISGSVLGSVIDAQILAAANEAITVASQYIPAASTVPAA
jgi:hypothetical protein